LKFFQIDFYGFAAMLASEDESNKDTVRNEGETGMILNSRGSMIN